MLKAKDQRKTEVHLRKKVQVLEEELDQVKNIPSQEDSKERSEEDDKFDVILQVKPEKVASIRTQLIDGQRCIVIPVSENEYTKINGKEDLV